jgi:hypothetical protein
MARPRNDTHADVVRRKELGDFLRNRRSELQPDDVGLPPIGRRRVPGLRRHEVADLAGVSVTWYTWLEQARNIRVSARAVDAVARALHLDEDAWRYARRLASVPVGEPRTISAEQGPYSQSLVDSLMPHPACFMTVARDFVAWNTSYSAVLGDPTDLPPLCRNALWALCMSPVIRQRMRGWEAAIPGAVAHFRSEAGKFPGDPRFSEVVSSLLESSSEFRIAWAEHHVQRFVPHDLVLDHPEVGEIRLNRLQLTAVDSPGLILGVNRSADARSRERLLALVEWKAELTNGNSHGNATVASS